MNKIWIPVVLLVLIVAGGFWYNGYVSGETDKMLELSEKAYDFAPADREECIRCLDEIDKRLEDISALLCAFLDRDIINEAQDAIVSARGLTDAGSIDAQSGIAEMKEKISHIKNSAQIKLKYIL